MQELPLSLNLLFFIMFSELLLANKSSRRLKGACFTMKENKLLSYISTLTPSQIEKLVNQLPQLYASISEQAPPYPREQISQNQQAV